MVDQSRLEDLRRRVQQDPASIAFAQLAEEYRRAGQYKESVEICRTGLTLHPGYLSARVTLGRALVELGHLDQAQHELETVLKGAPENLAAIRGLGEILQKRGALPEALAQYQAALALAKNDPELEQTVNDLARRLAPPMEHEPADGLSFAQMESEFARRAPDLVHKPPVPPAPTPQEARPPEEIRAAARSIEALEQWLAAIHAARTQQRA